MPIRFRPMRPNDVHECVEIVASHPIVGPRYGNAITDLGPAWLRLLYTDGFGTSAVLEETNGGVAKKLAVGVSVFVTESFLCEAKTLAFWVGPELAKRMACGQSPVLTPAQSREANAVGGLNVLVWEVTVRPEAGTRQEVMNTLMMAFHQYHRGFRMKEIASQAEGAINLLGMRNTGGLLWNTSGRRLPGILAGRPKRYSEEAAPNRHDAGISAGPKRLMARLAVPSLPAPANRFQPQRAAPAAFRHERQHRSGTE